MTQRPVSQEEAYRLAFDAFEQNGAVSDPPWARALREAALSHFNDLGFPTARRGNEEWKYTDVRPIARTAFHLPIALGAPAPIDASDLERLTFGESSWSRIVFVDGHYVEDLSSLSALPAGVSVVSLAKAMHTRPDLAERHLARYADYQDNAFTALNTAFLHDGAFVHIPEGIHLEAPIHLLFLTSGREPETVSHPRVLIITGQDSTATFIESYGGGSDRRCFTNAVTEVVVGPGSAIRYYKLQRQSEQAFHITTTQVALDRDSTFSSVNLDLGGGLVRHNLNVVMGAEGASCRLNGLYMVTGAQHVDNQVTIDHQKGYTTARELYKGILDGRSRSVFHGSIIVREGAQKVNAHQEDKNLLLSDQAEADTKPAFWIYCDDVRCGHGASCGQIDESALFYLRSRGMDEKLARQFLIRGFASQIVDSIESESFRAHVDALVQGKLGQWLEQGEHAPSAAADAAGAAPPPRGARKPVRRALGR